MLSGKQGLTGYHSNQHRLASFSSLTSRLPPPPPPRSVSVGCGGWAGHGGVCAGLLLCMRVLDICTTAWGVRGFYCKSCSAQNTLMDANKTPFQSRLSNKNVGEWKSTWWPFLQQKRGREGLTSKRRAGTHTVLIYKGHSKYRKCMNN